MTWAHSSWASLTTGAPAHWGIVRDGSNRITHADGTDELVEAGEVLHWPPGHTGVTDGGVTFLEVGPCGPMRQFGEHARQILGG